MNDMGDDLREIWVWNDMNEERYVTMMFLSESFCSTI